MEKGINFKKPGADSHARWLSKAIYSLKMFMFRNSFKMSSRDLKGLREICIFIILFYIKAWFTAPSAIQAPQSDLILLQELIQYRQKNSIIADAALSKLNNHLWYLSHQTVALAFFDENISIEIKKKMVLTLKCEDSFHNVDEKRLAIKATEYDTLCDKDISHFVSKRTLSFFEHFDINTEFLSTDPQNWERDDSFKTARNLVKNLKVVNDVAERGVALINDFLNCLTRDEEQRQFLLQVVTEHRKKYPNANKNTLHENKF